MALAVTHIFFRWDLARKLDFVPFLLQPGVYACGSGGHR